jgi:ATP-binding cassette subfamily F protein uup
VIPKKAAAKLSFKDQRRLEECEKEMGDLPVEIGKLEVKLADPGLYARDPKAFDAAMQAADVLRDRLAKAEEDWLALEEKREGLG